MIRVILHYAERHDIKLWECFPLNWRQTTSISPSQRLCLQYILEFEISRKEFYSEGRILSEVSREHINPIFSAKVDSLINGKVALKEVVLLAILSQCDNLTAIAFHKITEITKDLPSYILQPFQSYETWVHFAAANDLDKSVRRLCSRLQEEKPDIFPDLFPRNVQEVSLIHLATLSGSCSLLHYFIDFIRENKGNAALYLCQQDHLGYTPLHHAVQFSKLGSIQLIVEGIKTEQTPIFETSLLNCFECDHKGRFFDFLFEKIMAHGNNLLASILRWDSWKCNCLDYLKQERHGEDCSCSRKIDGMCALQWLKKQMEEEIGKVSQATSTTYKVNDFMQYLLHKEKQVEKTSQQKKRTFVRKILNQFSKNI